MNEFDIVINTLNQISIHGEEDASRLLGVIGWIRQKEQEAATREKAEAEKEEEAQREVHPAEGASK